MTNEIVYSTHMQFHLINN